jgi:hypothetical protein
VDNPTAGESRIVVALPAREKNRWCAEKSSTKKKELDEE